MQRSLTTPLEGVPIVTTVYRHIEERVGIAIVKTLYPYASGWGCFCPEYNTSQNCCDSAPWGLRFLNLFRLPIP